MRQSYGLTEEDSLSAKPVEVSRRSLANTALPLSHYRVLAILLENQPATHELMSIETDLHISKVREILPRLLRCKLVERERVRTQKNWVYSYTVTEKGRDKVYSYLNLLG